jgi:hypothetical protein
MPGIELLAAHRRVILVENKESRGGQYIMNNEQHSPRRLNFSGVVPSSILQTIVIDIVFPYMLYQLLISHVSSPIVFSLAALLPIANSIRAAVTLRILDLLGILALYVIAWVIIDKTVQSNIPIMPVLLTYTLPIGILSLITLGSRLLAKPLLFYVDRYFRAQTLEQIAIHNSYWQTKEAYRQMIYRLNLVWGIGQILIAVLLMVLFLFIPANIYSACALVITCLFYIILTMWSVHVTDTQDPNSSDENTDDTHTTSPISLRQDSW